MLKSLLNSELMKAVANRGIPEIEEETCDKCGTKNTYKVNDDGTRELVIKCDCHLRELVRADKKRMQQRKINYYFNQSLINPDLKKASFKNNDIDLEKASPEIYNAYKVASNFCKEFSKQNPKTIVIQGDTGTGKSFLAFSIARYLKDKGNTVLFIDNVELLSLIKASFNKKNDDTEEKIMRLVSEVDLLVLDDVGANKQTDWACEKLYEITNKRQGLNTIYTTNLDIMNEMPSDFMLKRAYSRICNGATFLTLDGRDRRLQ
ncbi:ATP-binding protein [Macrococcoides canis]|nr:ATP-binding protein [Macrococcus canis]